MDENVRGLPGCRDARNRNCNYAELRHGGSGFRRAASRRDSSRHAWHTRQLTLIYISERDFGPSVLYRHSQPTWRIDPNFIIIFYLGRLFNYHCVEFAYAGIRSTEVFHVNKNIQFKINDFYIDLICFSL